MLKVSVVSAISPGFVLHSGIFKPVPSNTPFTCIRAPRGHFHGVCKLMLAAGGILPRAPDSAGREHPASRAGRRSIYHFHKPMRSLYRHRTRLTSEPKRGGRAGDLELGVNFALSERANLVWLDAVTRVARRERRCGSSLDDLSLHDWLRIRIVRRLSNTL